MNRRAFTLVEVLVVSAIAITLMALLTPVLIQAKRAGQIASARSQLRQLYLVLALYREQQGPGTEYGTPEEMGLPGEDTNLLDIFTDHSLWISPCGTHPFYHVDPVRFQYDYSPFARDWPRLSQELGSRVALLRDVHCDDHAHPIRSIDFLHYGLAVRLDGSIYDKSDYGDMTHLDWWSN